MTGWRQTGRLARQIFGDIQAEYDRTVEAVLAIKGQSRLMELNR